MTPSFREKSAWTCLATTVAVYVPYFVYVYRLFDRGEFGAGSILGAFVAAAAVQAVLCIAAHAVFAIWGRQERADERDAAIDVRATRVAYYTLIASCFVMLGAALASSTAASGRSWGVALASQVVLLGFVVAEATRYATQVVSYRRGG